MKNLMRIALCGMVTCALLWSCGNDDDSPGTDPDPDVELNSEINDFVWKAMNHWYFWQANVTDLADSKDDDINTFNTFLNGFSDSEQLFNSLVNTSEDDFSWYIADVEAQLNEFRGISVSYGIGLPSQLLRLNSSSDQVIIYVTYVVPGSPADLAGVERGDLIYKVDGVEMNINNSLIINKLFTETNISLGLARIENQSLVPKGEDISLTAVQISENPVYYHSIIEEGGKKIGYLVYNGFRSTFHEELNNAFADFKSSNVDELILDLRYNGGGSVLSSAYLASMIDGGQADGSVFARLQYNNKRDSQNGSVYPFFDQAALFDKVTGEFTNTFIPINRLTSLSRLYVITTGQTASASEMIINGLRPSMTVTTIGETSVGKNEGSNTLVDSPGSSDSQAFLDIDNRNPNHKVALQPITFQIFNKQGQNDYDNGFEPSVLVEEFRFASNILPLGDTNEALLRAALDDIVGASGKKAIIQPDMNIQDQGRIKKQRFSLEMYILPQENIFN